MLARRNLVRGNLILSSLKYLNIKRVGDWYGACVGGGERIGGWYCAYKIRMMGPPQFTVE